MTRARPLATLPFQARRPGRESRVGTERWMVSYADLVTLLFAFFLVLYAVSRLDPGALAGFARSVQRGFRADDALDPPAPAGRSADDALRAQLASAGLGGIVPLRADERGITLTLPSDAFFYAGTATLQPDAQPLLTEVGGFLATLEGTIVVEGHTDGQPTGSTVHASAWELSAARAARVVRHLAEACGLEPARLSAVGLGHARPLQTGTDAAACRANRRLEIVVAR